ncbi:MAG: type I 3-dehydroquinate dehydratase [Planctomycetes bacterium]|nr:type I 3-dehydroquinate dehydratase [Planctomycetota bacterium]
MASIRFPFLRSAVILAKVALCSFNRKPQACATGAHTTVNHAHACGSRLNEQSLEQNPRLSGELQLDSMSEKLSVMICISILQESRRLALADMLNAGPQADLLEIRLDHFLKAPEIGEIIANQPKPLLMSCRRPQDGGYWKGSEEDRQSLLRQCIISKADYVEIELDVADQIRKFPPSRRVISYTNLTETPRDIAQIYEEAQKKSPDVIKLTTMARTPEEAWPLVSLVAKQTVPTVVAGLGKPGVMFIVLGKKLGAPWTHVALEKGMENFPGQATVRELETVYHYGAIDRSTRFIGVTGFSEADTLTVAMLNAALAQLELPARCLPLPMGGVGAFRKVMDAVRLASVVVDAPHRGQILEAVTHPEEAAKEAESADVIVKQDEQWHGYNTLWRAAISELESVMKSKSQTEKPLQGRVVMIVGTNAVGRSVAYGVKRRGGTPIFASRDPQAAQRTAQSFQCRYVQFEALYTTMHDVLIVCSDEKEKLKPGTSESGIHPGYLRPGMAVMDLSVMHQKSKLSRDAELRGCAVVSPRQVLLGQVDLEVRLITGKEVRRELLQESLVNTAGPEE